MEMDDDYAPYLDLQDDRELQAYAILKNQSFGHTNAFDSDLLTKTGELRVQANNIEDTLHQHIETNQAWPQYTGEMIHAMEQRQLQQQEEWRAYYRWMGCHPDQQQWA
ncbi:hypothetical protein C2845_PM07G11270 [Panicum miliaceum]|uniref:Uncharacterized protein n=1 Tax=Panicum miliaceum TaxID=4540 RepID=A0A3L6SNT7_PANMI|nr:hypothetical protein C2845_PM07G11270 [Panicum miliaceum]